MSENKVITSYDESMVGQDTVRTIWDLFLRRFKRHKPAIVSLIVLFVLAAICYSAPLYIDISAGDVQQQPVWRDLCTLYGRAWDM